MPEERRNALERMVETFNMTSSLPEDHRAPAGGQAFGREADDAANNDTQQAEQNQLYDRHRNHETLCRAEAFH